ncbi:RraA family protein [Histidinibacterium aquaticum]|uniref:Putative 4-hydroxy-4-methyl-2-oxoglutarate aldolase n=1 Tax=Histidinibacterium aquaticum TaxID=2613962 RepID=A0A5J5GL77_9RHOB|nr:RraA family protein [Histidinibacterium aquaticum]KAA9008787.1 RraA family protein [Histidinibacterium aquaticum]
MSIGFRVCTRRSKVDDAWVQKFRDLPVANISDVMSRVIGADLLPMHGDGHGLVGAALTVRTRPGDNLMVHKALDMAEPGDLIVVDAGGETKNAIIGELMVAHGLRRGIAGFVIDGAIRDVGTIRTMGLPVHARSVSHRGPYKDGPGEVNVPISVGGMVVHPGDLIVGDDDGIVAIPQGDAATIHALASRKQAAEQKQMEETKSGTLDRSWVDRALTAGSCEFVD